MTEDMSTETLPSTALRQQHTQSTRDREAALDDQLAVYAAQGNADAFGQLYDRYATRLTRLLQTYAWKGADVEDLVHETFCKVIHALPTYKPAGLFRSWLFKIALNVARKEVRKQRRVVRFRSQEAVSESAESPLDLYEQRRLGERLLGALDEPARLVVIMRIWFEFSYDEIADLLSIPSGTARRRMHTALKRMRTLFDSGQPGKEIQE